MRKHTWHNKTVAQTSIAKTWKGISEFDHLALNAHALVLMNKDDEYRDYKLVSFHRRRNRTVWSNDAGRITVSYNRARPVQNMWVVR